MQTAVRRATIYEPVVSILDLHLPPEVELPRGGGLRILEYIKSHLPDSKSCPPAVSKTRKACFAVGADEFLAKPFERKNCSRRCVGWRRVAEFV